MIVMNNTKPDVCAVCGDFVTENHHIMPMGLGGKQAWLNKIKLCYFCHRMIHRKHFDIEVFEGLRNLVWFLKCNKDVIKT